MAMYVGVVFGVVTYYWNKEPNKNEPITQWSMKSLMIIYIMTWLVCWAYHAFGTYAQSLYPHGEEPWVLIWFTETFENNTSEFFQVGSLVLLAKYHKFIDSPQSRDSDDKNEKRMIRIEEQLRINSAGEGLATITEMQDGTCKVTLMMPARRRYTIDLVAEGVNDGSPMRVVDRDPRQDGDPRFSGEPRLEHDPRLAGDPRREGDVRRDAE